MNKTGVNRNTKRQPHWNGKNPAQIPDAAPRSRTALDPVAYDNLIKQHGVRVKVYRSMYCPNVKSVDGGEHNLDCTLCNGSGYLDVDPLESVAYLANQNFQEEMTVEGYHDGNSVGATFLGGVELQYFTRVDLMDFTQPFYERVLRRAVDVSPGTAAVPEIPSTPGSIVVTFTSFADSEFISFSNTLASDGYFEQVAITPQRPVIDTNAIVFFFEPSVIAPGKVSITGGLGVFFEAKATRQDLVDTLNSITTDESGTLVDTGLNARTFRRRCVATLGPGSNQVTLTQLVGSPRVGMVSKSGGENSGVFNAGTAGTPAIPGIPPTGADDNLKYDCKRVNVIIDKQANQYHQDIDFKLTPQGNIQWLTRITNAATGASEFVRIPPVDTIFTAHYESVIQYRATSAMHINRFAQVPDRSTGLVAQVKMPEQWMLQKEFLIVRRDEYGNEIKKTGIFGDVIAAQPLNPAPADTI